MPYIHARADAVDRCRCGGRHRTTCRGRGAEPRVGHVHLGLDRETATQGFSQILSGGTATANQVEFVNLIVDYLTENGVMDPKRLWESPFTDKSPRGPEGVFSSKQVDELVAVLTEIRDRAAA